MTKKAAEAVKTNSRFAFELTSDEYAELIVALNYAWENVRAEDEAFNDGFSKKRLERVKRVREVVCNGFTIKEGE